MSGRGELDEFSGYEDSVVRCADRRNCKDEDMSHKQSAQEWARTAHLPYPPRWGQIESELLARAGRPPGSTVVQIVALCVVLVLLLVGYGAAGIGLVVIMVSDHPMDSGVVGLLQIVYVLAVAMPLSLLPPWIEERKRGAVSLAVSVASGAASLAAYLILRAEPDKGELGWIPLELLLAIATGFGVFLVILIASGPGRRRRLSPVIRMRTLLNPRNEMHYAQTRAKALEILFERSDVPLDEEARDELLNLKLGEWCRFDDPERD